MDFRHGENLHQFFIIHQRSGFIFHSSFSFILSAWHTQCSRDAKNMLIRRNRRGQGVRAQGRRRCSYLLRAAFEEQRRIAPLIILPVHSRNRSRQGAPQKARRRCSSLRQAAFEEQRRIGRLLDEHSIAEGEEPIPLPHRRLVRLHHVLAVVEGRDQHEQGGFG